MTIPSAESAEELFAAFPEWRALAQHEVDDSGRPFIAVVVPPPPEADVEHGLTIDTSNEEVTVGFDCYHSHFDDFIGDGDHIGTAAAIHFIRQIISERVAIVSWWQGDAWRGSSQIEAGAPPTRPSWAATQPIDRVRVRSWRGTHNHDGRA